MKDYCYRKIKKQYKVFPSAYASGAIVQCRRRLGKNPSDYPKRYVYFDPYAGKELFMSPTRYQKLLRRFLYLRGLIEKYAHLWPDSPRLQQWVYEYNTFTQAGEYSLENWQKRVVKEDWARANGFSAEGTGYDLLA